MSYDQRCIRKYRFNKIELRLSFAKEKKIDVLEQSQIITLYKLLLLLKVS